MNTDTPETKDAYQQRDGEGAMAHEIRRAQTMEKLERERDEARVLADRLARCLVISSWDHQKGDECQSAYEAWKESRSEFILDSKDDKPYCLAIPMVWGAD